MRKIINENESGGERIKGTRLNGAKYITWYRVHPNAAKLVDKDGRYIVDINRVCDVISAVYEDVATCWPNIGNVLKTKPIYIVESLKFKTMATDGYNIFINPCWAEDKLDQDPSGVIVEFAIIHEVFHILYRHCYEHANSILEHTDFDKCNRAQDYQINYAIGNFLRENGGRDPVFHDVASMEVEVDGKKHHVFCYDDKYAGMTWQEIYEVLPDVPKKTVKKQMSPVLAAAFKKEYDRLYDEYVKNGKLV